MKSRNEENVLIKLGNRIKELRIQNGYTNYEHFAYDHGISRTQYGKYEKGENMKFLSLLKILQGLDVTISDFFDGTEINPNDLNEQKSPLRKGTNKA